MARTIDLSPKLSSAVRPAEIELALDPGVVQMGQNIGGVSMFSNLFKRGYGDQTFGVSEEGMWLGAADFENAPIKFYMDGRFYMRTETGAIVITGDGITQYDENDVPVGYWGFREGMF